MQEDQDDYILPEYLPQGLTLNNFYHMRIHDLDTLLQHWAQRQASGQIPFRFKNVGRLDRYGKRASATTDDTPIEAGLGGQSESQPQDAHDDQEREGGGSVEVSESLAREGPDRQGQVTNTVRFPYFSWSWDYVHLFWYN
jgi:hypothetical protein